MNGKNFLQAPHPPSLKEIKFFQQWPTRLRHFRSKNEDKISQISLKEHFELWHSDIVIILIVKGIISSLSEP